MNQKWEIHRVSTSERIFDKINNEMAQPVGVVLFGADCEFKNEVQEDMMNALGGFAYHYTGIPNTATIVRALDERALTVTLNSYESAMHNLRHELVEVMRNAGAKTIVGIYAKAEKISIPMGKAMVFVCRDKQINEQIDAIEQSNPTTDEFDYFIVAEEKEE